MTEGQRHFKYSAFLSYSHRDRAWGEWLQHALETYSVPAELAGRPSPGGPVLQTLRPVFRDRWDLSAGHSLNEVIDAALRDSRHLVVLCSPGSAASAYVNEEIWRFKALGRGDRILPIIVGGRPGGGEEECFPKALRFDRDSSGALASTPEEPIAADARPEGDDKELAKLKIIAGMLGVGLDEIRKREAIEQAKRLRKARLTAGAMAVLALVAAAGGAVAWWQYSIAEEQRRVAEEQRQIADERRLEAERRYDQALDSTLRFVTTSATFRTLLDDKRDKLDAVRGALSVDPDNTAANTALDPAALLRLVANPDLKETRCSLNTFDIAQREEKGASSDFQSFIAERNADQIWHRLTGVLLNYEHDMPRELRRYSSDVRQAELPLQWIRHAEIIAGNLARSYPDEARYKARLVEVQAAITAQGCTPAAERSSDCKPSAVVPGEMLNAAPGAFNRMAQQAPMQQVARPACP